MAIIDRSYNGKWTIYMFAYLAVIVVLGAITGESRSTRIAMAAGAILIGLRYFYLIFTGKMCIAGTQKKHKNFIHECLCKKHNLK